MAIVKKGKATYGRGPYFIEKDGKRVSQYFKTKKAASIRLRYFE